MRSSNKCVLFSIFLMTYVFLSADSALISKYPNPNLGFPDRARSVANAVYSAIELPLVTFPFEKIEDEVAEMKYRIWQKSRGQVEAADPDAQFGYLKPNKTNI